MKFIKNFYLFDSRIATHVIFWVGYFILFGFLWVGEEGYKASFYLEFILLPVRILAVYLTIYFLLPKYLMKMKYVKFIMGYVLMLLFSGILQRVFIHLFYEELLLNNSSSGLFSIRMLIRAIVLINTTVLSVLAAKVVQLWMIEKEKNIRNNEKILEIKSNRKIHRVAVSSILFVEGLGNYVTYHLSDRSKITVYGSIKKALAVLPKNFTRVHRSYIVNRDHITSYDLNTIEVQNLSLPRGKSMAGETLWSDALRKGG